jgi:hypothetical protein
VKQKQGNRQSAIGNGEDGRSGPIAHSPLPIAPPSPKRVPLIYIAGPYRPTKAQRDWREREAWYMSDARFIARNIYAAHEAGRKVVEAGGMPLTPHKCTERFDGLIPDAEFLARDLGTYLPVCDALWAIDGWRESEGARGEVRHMAGLFRWIVFSEEEMRAMIAGWHQMRTGGFDWKISCQWIRKPEEIEAMIAGDDAQIPRARARGSDQSGEAVGNG